MKNAPLREWENGNTEGGLVYSNMPTSVGTDAKGLETVKTTGYNMTRMAALPAVLADGMKLPPCFMLKRKSLR